MPTLTYITTSSKNSDLPISVSELLRRHFFGIELIDTEGNYLDNATIEFYIRAATTDLENFLDLKITKRIIQETLEYNRQHFYEWGFIPVSYPVKKAISLIGMYAESQQIEYPESWLREKNTNAGDHDLHRQVNVLPLTGTGATGTVFTGIFPYLPMLGSMSKTIPNFWQFTYCTGWSHKEIPTDILSVIGKMAAIPIFHMLGDIILANAGIASQSISIDNLSQSINTTAGVENAGYGARITQYKKELELEIKTLEGSYNYINMTAI